MSSTYYYLAIDTDIIYPGTLYYNYGASSDVAIYKIDGSRLTHGAEYTLTATDYRWDITAPDRADLLLFGVYEQINFDSNFYIANEVIAASTNIDDVLTFVYDDSKLYNFLFRTDPADWAQFAFKISEIISSEQIQNTIALFSNASLTGGYHYPGKILTASISIADVGGTANATKTYTWFRYDGASYAEITNCGAF